MYLRKYKYFFNTVCTHKLTFCYRSEMIWNVVGIKLHVTYLTRTCQDQFGE